MPRLSWGFYPARNDPGDRLGFSHSHAAPCSPGACFETYERVSETFLSAKTRSTCREGTPAAEAFKSPPALLRLHLLDVTPAPTAASPTRSVTPLRLPFSSVSSPPHRPASSMSKHVDRWVKTEHPALTPRRGFPNQAYDPTRHLKGGGCNHFRFH